MKERKKKRKKKKEEKIEQIKLIFPRFFIFLFKKINDEI